ncbi:MAG: hypothetical protein WKF75_00765 [Singulisphaera sp.]
MSHGLAILLAGLAGCTGCTVEPPPIVPIPDASRNAKVGLTPPGTPTETKIVYLEQNWSIDDSLRYYFTTQGSQIVPYTWSLALEQPDAAKPFLGDDHMLKFGYLIQEKGPRNPDALPVGFVKDDGKERAWLGFTCAACHVAGRLQGGRLPDRRRPGPGGRAASSSRWPTPYGRLATRTPSSSGSPRRSSAGEH